MFVCPFLLYLSPAQMTDIRVGKYTKIYMYLYFIIANTLGELSIAIQCVASSSGGGCVSVIPWIPWA